MRRVLWVAAGGGGDVIGAAICARATGDNSDPVVIATWAWERLMVDPLPGPRAAADFDGLEVPAPGVCVVTGSTAPRLPAGSSLPRLAGELDVTLVLLDPAGGTRNLASQLTSAASWIGAQALEIVDVGGDSLARPGDTTLRSPLADVTTLVAAYLSGIPCRLVVLGPGLDGELAPFLVRQRLEDVGAVRGEGVSTETAQTVLSILEWHPSEATALLVAAALGHRGKVEMRDGHLAVVIDGESNFDWTVNALAALPDPPIVDGVGDANSLAALEETFRNLFGTDEIGYERRKSASFRTSRALSDAVARECIETFLVEAARRGTTWVTRRCLHEVVRRHGGATDDVLRHVGRRWVPPLVATRPS